MAGNIMQMLVLSTGHLTWETIRLLETTPVLSERYPVMGAPIPYGFLVYAHDEDGAGNIPPDLWACCQHAVSLNCSYIRFDAEEDLVEGLTDHTGTHGKAGVGVAKESTQAHAASGASGRLSAELAVPPTADDDEVDVCSDCGAQLADAGDGYDGRCPTCADRADAST